MYYRCRLRDLAVQPYLDRQHIGSADFAGGIEIMAEIDPVHRLARAVERCDILR
jgi:hypothetical protein